MISILMVIRAVANRHPFYAYYYPSDNCNFMLSQLFDHIDDNTSKFD